MTVMLLLLCEVRTLLKMRRVHLNGFILMSKLTQHNVMVVCVRIQTKIFISCTGLSADALLTHLLDSYQLTSLCHVMKANLREIQLYISRQHAEWTSVLSFNVCAVIHQNCMYLLKGDKGWAATDNVHLRAARWAMPSRRGPHVMWQAGPLPTYGVNWASKLKPASKHPDKRSQWDAKLLVTSLHLPAPRSLCTAAGPLVSGATSSHSVENGSISWRPGITCKWWEQTQSITFRNILYLEGSVERF